MSRDGERRFAFRFAIKLFDVNLVGTCNFYSKCNRRSTLRSACRQFANDAIENGFPVGPSNLHREWRRHIIPTPKDQTQRAACAERRLLADAFDVSGALDVSWQNEVGLCRPMRRLFSSRPL